MYLYSLAAAGQAGVERALGQYRSEIERGMKLMGCKNIADLSRSNLRRPLLRDGDDLALTESGVPPRWNEIPTTTTLPGPSSGGAFSV
jgi:hypothetical protein